MIPKKLSLSQSILLSAIQTDKFKTETLSVSIVMPTEEKNSPASLLALSILKRGCEKFKTQGEINLRLDELYATSISMKSHRLGDANVLGFSAEMLCEDYTDGKTDVFGGTLDVLNQMLFHPLTDGEGYFLPSYIESEKNNQCDAIEAQINNPRAYASKRCREIMFAGEPYGISLLGTADTVRAITKDELSACYQSMISEHRYSFFYIGPRSIEEVAKRLEEAFLPHASQGQARPIPQTAAAKRSGDVRRVVEEMPLAQGKLVLGFLTGVGIQSEDFYTMLVLNEIYGGSPVSKLFMNVREKLSLCYYCGSGDNGQKGFLTVHSGIEFKNEKKAADEIDAERLRSALQRVGDLEIALG